MDDADIEEAFADLGPVTIRRMFGGRGVYHQGLVLALVVDGELLLKADDATAAEFEAAGARRWTYAGRNRPVRMPYWSAPDEAWDDPERMARWTRRAFEAALRSAAAKTAPRRRPA